MITSSILYLPRQCKAHCRLYYVTSLQSEWACFPTRLSHSFQIFHVFSVAVATATSRTFRQVSPLLHHLWWLEMALSDPRAANGRRQRWRGTGRNRGGCAETGPGARTRRPSGTIMTGASAALGWNGCDGEDTSLRITKKKKKKKKTHTKAFTAFTSLVQDIHRWCSGLNNNSVHLKKLYI